VRRGALLAGVAAAAALAGCGSGDEERLTPAEFRATTDAICASYTRRAEEQLGPSSIDPTSPTASALDIARFARQIQRLATLVGEQLEDLQAVRAPAESARTYSQGLALFGQIENALVRAARAARKGDRRGVAVIGKQLFALNAQVDALGFTCE
jgi:hypothetical protein